MFDSKLAQSPVRFVHITDNNGDMLKPQIMTAGIRGDGSASGRRNVLGQNDKLFAESHADHPHSDAEQSMERFVCAPRYLYI